VPTRDASEPDDSDQEPPVADPASGARLRVVAEVSHAFASAVTDYRRLVETIVRTTADHVGDGCQIFLVSDDGLSLINAGNAHCDEAVESDIRNFLAGPPQTLATSHMVSAEVVRSGEEYADKLDAYGPTRQWARAQPSTLPSKGRPKHDR
jgi:hypothetical protein